jgi:3-oxoacyl-[acyl-carrier-protein] synthase-1
MDALSKVLFVASELLMQRFGCECEGKRCSMIIFNSSSSIVSDRKHIATFERSDEFYPSPSIFIGTLPNIALGEFAIKHNCTGETSLYILASRSDALMAEVVESAMSQSDTDIMLTGWVDCSSEDSFEAELVILTK